MALEASTEHETRDRIAALLRVAMEAHAQFESVVLRTHDPNWPRWVAGFVLDRNMSRLIRMSLGEEQLARLLQSYENDYAAQGIDGARPEYFAQRLVQDAK